MGKIQSMDEALLLLSEGLSDTARAPNIKRYKPHEKQHLFHASTKKKKLYIGGNRSGKTTGGVCEDIWRATCRHPYRPDLNEIGPNRGRVVAVDFVNGVEKIIFPQFQQWLYPSALKGGAWETAYNKLLRTLTFSNGSTIEFMSYDQDLDKFAGTSRHWIHFDEEPPKSIYIENMARIIDTDGDFWITMTPVEGMTWVYEDLYEQNHNNADGVVEVIEVNTLENPYLTRNAIQSFIDSIDKDEADARIKGEFIQVGGRIYKNFDPTIGGLHVLSEPIEKPKQRFKDCLWIMCLDHGLNNPTAVLWLAVDTKGFITVFREHYRKEWTIDQHAAHINKINREHGRIPDLMVADPSIANRNPVTGTSIHEEYIKYGLPFVMGNNDVKAGIIRVKKYLNPVKLRGKQELGSRIRITPNCSNLIWEMKKYRWKTYTNKKLAYENNAFEEPHKKDDHACDSLRYGIMTQPDLIAEVESNFDKVNNSLADFEFAEAVSMQRLADPQGLLENPNWNEGNSIPGDYAGWDTDEHMGGIL
jgi:phage terminase large subunit-like protein